MFSATREGPSRADPCTADVVLLVLEDDGFVYFCYALPADNLEFADLYVDTSSLERPRQLHASAKLGEWDVGEPTPTWWNHSGWVANVAWFDGAVLAADGSPRTDFLPAPGREFQLSKERFGRGAAFHARGTLDSRRRATRRSAHAERCHRHRNDVLAHAGRRIARYPRGLVLGSRSQKSRIAIRAPSVERLYPACLDWMSQRPETMRRLHSTMPASTVPPKPKRTERSGTSRR